MPCYCVCAVPEGIEVPQGNSSSCSFFLLLSLERSNPATPPSFQPPFPDWLRGRASMRGLVIPVACLLGSASLGLFFSLTEQRGGGGGGGGGSWEGGTAERRVAACSSLKVQGRRMVREPRNSSFFFFFSYFCFVGCSTCNVSAVNLQLVCSGLALVSLQVIWAAVRSVQLLGCHRSSSLCCFFVCHCSAGLWASSCMRWQVILKCVLLSAASLSGEVRGGGGGCADGPLCSFSVCASCRF